MFWYKQAADSGYPKAAYKYGFMLDSGPGANQSESVRYLCQAAKAGSKPALQALGSRRSMCR
jgi:TPR repeat protein